MEKKRQSQTKTARLTLRLQPQLRRQLEELAAAEDRTVSQLVALLLTFSTNVCEQAGSLGALDEARLLMPRRKGKRIPARPPAQKRGRS